MKVQFKGGPKGILVRPSDPVCSLDLGIRVVFEDVDGDDRDAGKGLPPCQGAMIARYAPKMAIRPELKGTNRVSKGRIELLELEEDAPFACEGGNRELLEWLEGYCEGRILPFPLDLSDLPPFTRRCLEQLVHIPWGEMRSYGEVASSLGSPRAARAVGNACGRNPFPLVIPCHRVVGHNSLGGFSLPLSIKKRLLRFEQNKPLTLVKKSRSK